MNLFLILSLFVCVAFAGHQSHGGGGGNYGGDGGYFQYANVPAYGQYEFGYNRGNPHHYTSRYEQGNNWRFRTKVRWGDKKGGYGEHYWDYNHVDKGHHGGHGGGHGKGHGGKGYSGHHHHGGHGHGAYSDQIPVIDSHNAQSAPSEIQAVRMHNNNHNNINIHNQ